jgi:hypothetical protein
MRTIKRKAAGAIQTAKLNLQNNYTNQTQAHQVNFREVNQLAIVYLPSLVSKWLPDGKVLGHEYTALNPKRNDNKAGSFKINLITGRWADFATGDKGGDVISLAAYLSDLSQINAAKAILRMLGVRHA